MERGVETQIDFSAGSMHARLRDGAFFRGSDDGQTRGGAGVCCAIVRLVSYIKVVERA